MKKASTTLATMIMISGLVLCCAEAPTIQGQFSCISIGLVALCGGGYWVTRILRG